MTFQEIFDLVQDNESGEMCALFKWAKENASQEAKDQFVEYYEDWTDIERIAVSHPNEAFEGAPGWDELRESEYYS